MNVDIDVCDLLGAGHFDLKSDAPLNSIQKQQDVFPLAHALLIPRIFSDHFRQITLRDGVQNIESPLSHVCLLTSAEVA